MSKCFLPDVVDIIVKIINQPHCVSVCVCVYVCQSVYKWRIDLSKSEKYWDGWFRGTSNLFLACNLPKLLLLAGM